MMAPFYARHMRQTLTYWPRLGGTYGAAVVYAPGGLGGVRWTPERRNKFTRETERRAAPLITALVPKPLAVGGIVALGAFPGLSPIQATDPHEITEFRETNNLMDEWTVTRIMAKPLLGQLWQSVTIWPMVRVETDRSYVAQRAAAAIYTGPASVDMTSAPDAEPSPVAYASSLVTERPVVVTVPYSAAVDASASYEIDWISPAGALIIEAASPAWNNDSSPFWRSLAGKIRRPQV